MTRFSVDRLEGCLAVLVDDEGNSRPEPVDSLPVGTKEGSILVLTEDGFALDPDTEKERREQILSLQEKLRRRAR